MSLASRLYSGDAGIDVVGRRKIWYLASLALLVLCLGSFVVKGFNYGIEFSGGNSFQVPAAGLSLEQTRDAVAGAVTDADGSAVVTSVQRVGGGAESYLVRTSELTAQQSDQAKQAISRTLRVPAAEISDDRVSGSWGDQITRKALQGLGVFLVLVVLYLSFRFEWKMAVGAMVALVHDLVLTAGVYSLVGFEVTPSTVIGLLTILGFSLYDTVVVFDKVEENTRGILGGARYTYGEAANLAVNQTLMRSINTTLIALLPVGGLLFIGAGFLGAGTLKDLGLVLFVGMAAGAYSSIFLATPIVVDLKEREPRYAALRNRVRAKRSGTGPSPSQAGATRVGAKTAAPGRARRRGASVAVLDEDGADRAGRTDVLDSDVLDDDELEPDGGETRSPEPATAGAVRGATRTQVDPLVSLAGSGASVVGAEPRSGGRPAARADQRRRSTKSGRPSGSKRKR